VQEVRYAFTTKVFTMKKGAIFGITAGVLVIFITFSSWPRTSKFDAGKWKSGTSVSKGAMVEDLIEHRLLIGKPRAEVLAILGEPDDCVIPSPTFPGLQRSTCADPRVFSLGYKVITISRCYFWNCEMNVNLNRTTYIVEEVNVSD
jgi:hypothetical protein